MKTKEKKRSGNAAHMFAMSVNDSTFIHVCKSINSGAFLQIFDFLIKKKHKLSDHWLIYSKLKTCSNADYFVYQVNVRMYKKMSKTVLYNRDKFVVSILTSITTINE